MLLVHGFPEFWYSWRYQLKEFSSHYRVVAVDQRGYGDSDKPSSVYDYRLPMLVNDLKELIIALDYKKCVLVGHDWGGIVAWAFAQTVPDMVEHLIVMNAPSPHAFLNHASNSLSQLKKSWYFFFFQVPYIPELIISLLDFDFLSNAFTGKTMGVRSGSVTEDDVEAYKFTFQRNGLTAPINFYRGLVRYPDFAFSRLQSLQSKVMCPTLIIWGCKDGALEKELAALSTEMVAGEDVRLHYVTNGSEDKPLLLLVHGFPEFWYSWRYQLKEFHDNYSISQHIIIFRIGCKKCTVVGHDWGGIIAWAFAQTTPDMVERLIILNCPSSAAYVKHCSNGLSQLKKSWYITLFQVPWIPELFLSTEDYAALTNSFTARPMGVRSGAMTENDVEAYKYTFQRNGFTAPLNYYRALLRYPQFAFIRLQSPQLRVTCPTLIIWGCNDAALDKELAALSAETVEGDVTVKYIEECSHWTQMDRPEDVNKYMREFLEKTEKKTML
ncbi:hypothetical protein C0Q70_04618 [Pomacea canaliculata]|uniref:AB hydrolase-1 domain-containing protein n=1 Tax=Pomacea canaliculata TaxID=400727 RepID=A0A2T7PIX0_POMCA|nr:hypothetical protein C0Q70_04618 [Pomacea canaliculata]